MNTPETRKVNQAIIRKTELQSMLGISDPSIYRWEREGKFPKRLQLGGNSVGWLLSEVEGWIQARADARKGC